MIYSSNFQEMLSKIKLKFIKYLRESNSTLDLSEIEKSLENPSTVLNQIVEFMALHEIERERNLQEQTKQLFRATCTDSDALDLIASNFGLTRFEGETDEHLKMRFDLAPYQIHTTGTRQSYRFHALTMGSRPHSEVHKSGNKATVSYFFNEHNPPQVFDAQASSEHGSNVVTVAIMSKKGEAEQTLIDEVQAYLTRDDIAQATDDVKVVSGQPNLFSLTVNVVRDRKSAKDIDENLLRTDIENYLQSCKKLGVSVTFLQVGVICNKHGALDVTMNHNLSFESDFNQFPLCEELIINVD